MSTAQAISICSRAMTLIGADPVIDFDDGTTEAQVSSALYESTLRSVLTEHRWNFTIKQIQASKLSTTPSVGYQFKYSLPSPVLSIDKIIPMNISYELYASNEIHTDYDGELWVEGQFRVDESEFKDYFSEYLEYRLASKFAFPITADPTLASSMSDQASRHQKLAKSADSKQRKGVGFKRFSLVDVR